MMTTNKADKCPRCGSDDLYDFGHCQECMDCDARIWVDDGKVSSASGNAVAEYKSAVSDSNEGGICP